jgi:hypothetical protein
MAWFKVETRLKGTKDCAALRFITGLLQSDKLGVTTAIGLSPTFAHNFPAHPDYYCTYRRTGSSTTLAPFA